MEVNFHTIESCQNRILLSRILKLVVLVKKWVGRPYKSVFLDI